MRIRYETLNDLYMKRNTTSTEIIVPEVVTILDNMPFTTREQFRIPVKECVQFHSKALPENQVLSNHYDCIIRYRDCEFYSVEQLFLALTYSENRDILREIMKCKSGIEAKGLCRKKYKDMRDKDFRVKEYRIIALCHLYKYLSVKEYRDRLRETGDMILVECPSGSDRSFGMVQNMETNIFEGSNCSGRTTMIVRDMMRKLEDEAICEREKELGRKLNDEEREAVVVEVCDRVRAKFDADPVMLEDSRRVFEFIEDENIAKVKERRPKFKKVPELDKGRCLVLDFDYCIFDTSADDKYRKCKGKKNMEKAFEMIPEYKLYEGMRKVFEYCRENKIKIGVLSSASRALIEKALEHFGLPCDAVVGFQLYIGMPDAILGNRLMTKLNVREDQIVYIGASEVAETQARCSKFDFYGAAWHNPANEPFTAKGAKVLGSPLDIIGVL